MSGLEYKFLRGRWSNSDHVMYRETSEKCFQEGWIDEKSQVTPRGDLAMTLYEAFSKEWTHEDDLYDDLDDDVPWTGDSVLYMDHYRTSTPAKAAPADEPKREPVMAVRSPSYLAAPEDEANYG
jgi:hypothetical protein